MKEIREEGILTYFKPKINYIPENLNLHEWASSQKLYGFKKFSKDTCAELISPLYTRAVYNKKVREELEKDPRAYVALSSEIMYQKCKDYKKYIDLLVKSGVLECNSSYSTGSRCKGYRFTETYTGQPYQVYYNYEYGKEKAEQENATSTLILEYHTSTVTTLIENLDKVQLDYTSSIARLKADYLQGRISTLEHNCAGISLEKIHNKKFFATQDGYGRLHTNVVNLKKEYRNYLTTDTGEKLVSIDIKNCQPFLTTLLLKSSFWEGKIDESSSLLTVDQLQPKTIKSLQQPNIIETLIMFTKSVEDNVDMIKYKKLVLSGYLYEFLLKKFQEAGINCPDRKAAKEKVYQVFFSKVYHLKTIKAAQVFKELFPTVYQLFAEIKKKEHNLLATLLQSIESQIVIEGVCKLFISKNPGVPVLTIHDSVLVPIDKTEIMENILVGYTAEKVGHKPAISIEVLEEPSDVKAAVAA